MTLLVGNIDRRDSYQAEVKKGTRQIFFEARDADTIKINSARELGPLRRLTSVFNIPQFLRIVYFHCVRAGKQLL